MDMTEGRCFSLTAANSSQLPLLSQTLSFSLERTSPLGLACRIWGLLAARLARRIICASVSEKGLHQRVELDRVFLRL